MCREVQGDAAARRSKKPMPPSQSPPTSSHPAPRLAVEDVIARLSIFSIGRVDEQNLAVVREVLRAHSTEIVARFYEHLSAFAECRQLLVPELLVERLKASQRSYLGTLGDFRIDDPASVVAYFEHRRRIGVVHHRVGLGPGVYAGAYAKLGDLAMATVAAAHPQRPNLLTSLHKVFGLDSYLALEAYQQTREAVIHVTALRDALTGIGSRASTLEALERELARAHRFVRPISLLFVDVDHFKVVNDSHGHAAGDKVLRAVARVLETSVRPADLVGRYGGDEFIVGLVDTDLASALRVAERIRGSIASAPGGAGVTLSIGAAARADGDTLEALLARADSAMYAAKAGGRDRVAASSDVEGTSPSERSVG